MLGTITSRDVIENLGVIASEFGVFCLLRCLLALARRRPTTFLDVAVKAR